MGVLRRLGANPDKAMSTWPGGRVGGSSYAPEVGPPDDSPAAVL